MKIMLKMFKIIRKFSLEHCDLPTMMWNVSVLLRALTLNIDVRNHKRIPPIIYFLVIISGGCYFYVYLVSMVWFVFWRCMETGDKLSALIVFSLGVSSEIGPVKLIYTIFHAKQVRKIVTACLASDSRVVPGSRFSNNLLKTLRKVKKRAIIFWVIMMSNGVIYIAMPFLKPGRNLMDEQFMFYGLEPMLESPNYEAALFINTVAVMFTCYSTASITAFVIVNVGYIEAQMLSWSEELNHIWDDAKDYYSNTQPTENFVDISHNISNRARNIALNKFVENQLKIVIRSHARNLDLLHQIEDALKGAIAIEFFILIIGLIAELLGGLENTYIEVPFSFVQVAVDCMIGQWLTDASEVFRQAVYDCQWENFDRPNMKLVLLILQTSQKLMILSAGGLATLNYKCLMSLVRSIYSAYTTLRSTMA